MRRQKQARPLFLTEGGQGAAGDRERRACEEREERCLAAAAPPCREGGCGRRKVVSKDVRRPSLCHPSGACRRPGKHRHQQPDEQLTRAHWLGARDLSERAYYEPKALLWHLQIDVPEEHLPNTSGLQRHVCGDEVIHVVTTLKIEGNTQRDERNAAGAINAHCLERCRPVPTQRRAHTASFGFEEHGSMHQRASSPA